MRKVAIALVAFLIAGAFVAGYWPQRDRLSRTEAELADARRQSSQAQSQLAMLESQLRLGRLFGEYLALADAVSASNFGEAQRLSSVFFDRVREEAAGTSDATVRPSLDAVLMRRDAVTAGLARSDASVSQVLAPIERELRRALGYPLPSLEVAPPAGARP